MSPDAPRRGNGGGVPEWLRPPESPRRPEPPPAAAPRHPAGPANLVLRLLEELRADPKSGIERLDLPARLACLLITPRFRNSSHVVFLLLPAGRPEPVLVAKVPRLAGVVAGLAGEAEVLRRIDAALPGGCGATIPRLVAYAPSGDRPVLLETALVGRPLDPAAARRAPETHCRAAVDWLLEVQPPLARRAADCPGWFERRIEQPLAALAAGAALPPADLELIERTRACAAVLRDEPPPLVLEHGDLSHPNLFVLRDGRLGVVDWELAELAGLPVVDLVFFLSYVAAARLGRRRPRAPAVEAFHRAFVDREGWARRHVEVYAERLGVPRACLAPLSVLVWPLFLSRLLVRLGVDAAAGERAGAGTAAWIRAHRYFAVWRHAVAHMGALASWGAARRRPSLEG